MVDCFLHSFQSKLSGVHPTLSLFNPADSKRSVGARTTGADPVGALFALNSKLGWDLAGRLAKRVEGEVGSDRRKQAERAYLLTLSRPPDEAELKTAMSFLGGSSERPLTDFCHLLFGLNEFI